MPCRRHRRPRAAETDGDLVRVKDALAAVEEAKMVTEEARRKAESEATRLEVDQTSPAVSRAQPAVSWRFLSHIAAMSLPYRRACRDTPQQPSLRLSRYN